MSASRIANRYAKALMELAVDKGVVDGVLADMNIIGTAAEESELKSFLNSPIIEKKKKKSALTAVFQSKINPLSMQFLLWVTERGRESILPDMARAFLAQYNRDKRITQVYLTTAVEIDDSSVELIVDKLKKHMKDEGGKYEIVKRVDPQILGGFKLQFGDKLYDSSLKNTLQEMRKALRNK